ncbi:hypothetical protein ACFQ0G_42260 [Streptomyces chiangmaiensis]
MRMSVARLLMGVAGLALMGVGVFRLLDVSDLTGVLIWLGAAVALHDALIAPLVLLIGLLLVRGRVRGPVRGALLVTGALTAVALPVLLRREGPPTRRFCPWITRATGSSHWWRWRRSRPSCRPRGGSAAAVDGHPRRPVSPPAGRAS